MFNVLQLLVASSSCICVIDVGFLLIISLLCWFYCYWQSSKIVKGLFLVNKSVLHGKNSTTVKIC